MVSQQVSYYYLSYMQLILHNFCPSAPLKFIIPSFSYSYCSFIVYKREYRNLFENRVFVSRY